MLRTNRGDEFSRASGPERVVKRAQSLAVGSAVSSPTSDKEFDIFSSSARLGERFVEYRQDSMSICCYTMPIDWPWFVLSMGMFSSIGRPVFSHCKPGLLSQRVRWKLLAAPCPASVSLFRPYAGRARRRMAGPKLNGAISDPLEGA